MILLDIIQNFRYIQWDFTFIIKFHCRLPKQLRKMLCNARNFNRFTDKKSEEMMLHVCTLNIFITPHSVPECGFEGLKQQQPPAHIWDLPRLWKSLLLMYKIFDMRTCGLSHQIKGPTTVKLAKSGFNCKIVKFTITGPLI